jgi:plastocyanin
MIDTFDSRALRVTDCYGQRFMKPGTYRYNVVPAHGHGITEERPFSIEVKERSAQPKMSQKSVVVTAEGGRFTVQPDVLTIETGDIVLWNCPDSKALPYTVMGDKEFFGSHRLTNECGYTHAFGSPGEYRWSDAYGSGVSGTVRVKSPECRHQADLDRWRKLLKKGTVVMVTEGRAEPREVQIVTGQTVFFAITKGPGISITDERVLALRQPDGKTSSEKTKS